MKKIVKKQFGQPDVVQYVNALDQFTKTPIADADLYSVIYQTHTGEIIAVITGNQYREYIKPGNQRRSIQSIMPNLTPDQREFIMTGIKPGQWDEIMEL